MNSATKSLLIFAISLSTMATNLIEGRNNGENRWLPKYGKVTADRLCHFDNETMLRITTPAVEKKICLKKEYRPNSSGYMVPTCVQFKIEIEPETVVETSVNYIGKVCVKREYKMNTNGYHLPYCVQFKDVAKVDRLEYTTEAFEVSDIFRQNPIEIERKIPACQ